MPVARRRFFASGCCCVCVFSGYKAEAAEFIEVRIQWAREGGQARGLHVAQQSSRASQRLEREKGGNPMTRWASHPVTYGISEAG